MKLTVFNKVSKDDSGQETKTSVSLKLGPAVSRVAALGIVGLVLYPPAGLFILGVSAFADWTNGEFPRIEKTKDTKSLPAPGKPADPKPEM